MLHGYEVHGECAFEIDTPMSGGAYSGRFRSLIGLFDYDTATIFVDNHAHVTEAANLRIAGRITDELVPLLAHAQGPTTLQ